MTIDDALAWLFSTQQFGIKLGLDNTRRLLAALGDPQERLRIFHIAGTNGKGSVCALLDVLLRSSGHRTGLYTSPHLVDFRERIRVDGAKIPVPDTADTLTRLRDLTATWDHSPTFFEFATALALDHFARTECDFVVLETGMGGRLDATNAVNPIATLLTPIALDHTEWLGDTLAQIASEKAGIIKAGIPALSSPQAPAVAEVFCSTAAALNAPLRFVDTTSEFPVALPGSFQRRNAALALAALESAGIQIPNESVRKAFAAVSLPARFQRLGDHIVIDGSHNSHATSHLVQNWREHFGSQRATILFGSLADKDFVQMLALLEPIANDFLLVPVRSARTAKPADYAPPIRAPHRILDSATQALKSPPDGPLLITGSLFLAGEALQALGFEP